MDIGIGVAGSFGGGIRWISELESLDLSEGEAMDLSKGISLDLSISKGHHYY